jgi:hypothetical protein
VSGGTSAHASEHRWLGGEGGGTIVVDRELTRGLRMSRKCDNL